jgi:myo-inositol catabolism protein IolC
MPLGYQGELFVMAFDHRGSFREKMFGIEGEPSPEQRAAISDVKRVIFEGTARAVEKGGLDPATVGALIDEESGAPARIPEDARAAGLRLAMPVEKSGRELFDFEYGNEFGEHILRFDPDLSKVLVRYNPEGDAGDNQQQQGKLKELSEWLHHHGRRFLFELLVPAVGAQLTRVGADVERYDAELRPGLMRRAITEFQDFGVEVDIWKIEGVDRREDAEMIAEQSRRGEGREGVVCVVLGRGASATRVEGWLRVAAPVKGYVGFAIGRSIWWDPSRELLAESLTRDEARERIAENFLRFHEVYASAAA